MAQVPPEVQQRLNSTFLDAAARIERAGRLLVEVGRQELIELELAAGGERAKQALAAAAEAVIETQRGIQRPRH